MTEEQYRQAQKIFDGSKCAIADCEECKILAAYRAEFERMRQFIRNLADESRVYLESEESDG